MALGGARHLRAVLGAALLAILMAPAWACGRGAEIGRQAPPAGAAPEAPEVRPSAWLVVDPRSPALLEGTPIYHQGPEPPAFLHREALRLPLKQEAPGGRPPLVLVQAVVSAEGRVVQARILRKPRLPEIGDTDLERCLVETLGRFRLKPARLHAEAVAVYFNLTLEVLPAGSAEGGSPSDLP